MRYKVQDEEVSKSGEAEKSNLYAAVCNAVLPNLSVQLMLISPMFFNLQDENYGEADS